MTLHWPRKTYIQQVIQCYLQLPETPARSRPPDRRLAGQLFDRTVPIAVVQQALMLASLRRICRPQNAPRLSPIRSLYYFLPVIEEIIEQPLPNGYTQYLERKLQLWSHSSAISTPASVHKTAVAEDR